MAETNEQMAARLEQMLRDNRAAVSVMPLACAVRAGAEALRAQADTRRAVLADVARSCGVEMDDARLRYIVVQIDRDTWDEMQAALKEDR